MGVSKVRRALRDLKTNFIYGFDLHGIIDTDPSGYKQLFRQLRDCGHKVFIISGPRKHQLKNELRKLGISKGRDYDELFSVVDFLKSKGVKMKQDDNGNWWTGDIDWWSSKAQICRINGVDFMFDDTYTYKQFFANTHTKFVHLQQE